MRTKLTPLLALLALLAACSRTEETAEPLAPNLQQGIALTEGDLKWVAETAIMESFPVQLATTVKVENVGSKPAVVEIANGCPIFLRAYRTPDRTGTPDWDQAQHVFCTMALEVVQLGPGESRSFTTRTNAAEILGNSLPNGHYYLAAFVNKTGSGIQLDAGEADLAR